MVAVIFYSPLLFQTRVAHISAEGNITHEVHITRRRRIELAHLLYRRCAIRLFYCLVVIKIVFARDDILDVLIHALSDVALYYSYRNAKADGNGDCNDKERHADIL